MIAGEVMGRLWNDRQVHDLEQHRLVTVRTHDGGLIIAVDLVEVSAGNVVIVATDESAHAAIGKYCAIDAAVIGLVGGADKFEELRSTEVSV